MVLTSSAAAAPPAWHDQARSHSALAGRRPLRARGLLQRSSGPLPWLSRVAGGRIDRVSSECPSFGGLQLRLLESSATAGGRLARRLTIHRVLVRVTPAEAHADGDPALLQHR